MYQDQSNPNPPQNIEKYRHASVKLILHRFYNVNTNIIHADSNLMCCNIVWSNLCNVLLQTNYLIHFLNLNIEINKILILH